MSLAIVVLTLLLFSVQVIYAQTCTDPDADVLILGGGIAGVAAAHHLHQKGISNFILLEAQANLGGRTVRKEIGDGFYVNGGASWIQGIDPDQLQRHPLMSLAQRCGGLETIVSDSDSIKVYNSSGTVFTPQYLMKLDHEYYPASDFALGSFTESRKNQNLPDISMREALTAGNWSLRKPLDGFTEWFAFDFCFSESPDVSSLYGSTNPTYSDFGDPEQTTDYYVSDQRGFVYLTDCLASNFSTGSNDKRVHLNAEVSKIEYSDDCVCVEATENAANRKYCAPYAILTFSMGVLQSENFRNMVSPPFSQAKLDAMRTFSMVHYLHIYAVFEDRFWSGDDVFYVGHVHEQRGYFPLVIPLQFFNKSQLNVTVLAVTNSLADRIVQQNLSTTVEEITQVFRGIYGPNVPPPIQVLFNDFRNNPLFLGSFTNLHVGFQDNTFPDVSRPEGRLHFSGDAFHDKYNGFSHGAYLSGIDTANEIASKIKESSGFHLLPSELFSFYLAILPVLVLVLCTYMR